jgi:hypothetical protein
MSENKDKKGNHLLLEFVEKIVYMVLRKHNLLQGEYHLGKVKTVISNRLLEVYIDGSDQSQKVKCNPDVTFSVNDTVYVIYANRDSKNKFVICRK